MKTPRISLLAVLLTAPLLVNPVMAEELLIYSGRSEKFIKPLMDQFSAQTGIKVTLKSGDSSLLLSKMSLEDEKTPADLFIGNDVGNLQLGSDYNLFKELPDSILNAVPREHRSPHKDWLGLSGRLRVLVVNKRSPLAGELDSIYDLSSPQMKGRIGLTKGNNESFIGGVTSYLYVVGKEKNRQWLQNINSNADGRVFEKHSQIVQAVADGEIDIGLVNHYYAINHLKMHPDAPIRIVIPDQQKNDIGAAWNMAGIAISRYTKNADAAEKLVRFLISEQGQKMFAEVNHEYPVIKGVPIAEGVPAMDTVRLVATPIEEIGRMREKTIVEIRRHGLLHSTGGM